MKSDTADTTSGSETTRIEERITVMSSPPVRNMLRLLASHLISDGHVDLATLADTFLKAAKSTQEEGVAYGEELIAVGMELAEAAATLRAELIGENSIPRGEN